MPHNFSSCMNGAAAFRGFVQHGILALSFSVALTGCGGGGGPAGGSLPQPVVNAQTGSANNTASLVIAGACVAGAGTDYQVGPGPGQLASLDLVPWDQLVAGDTVRIFYNNGTPYKGKMLIAANGTADKPVRVCGVKGAGGQRPIIDGDGAVARAGLSYTSAGYGHIQETRSLIMVDRLGTGDWFNDYPKFIQVDGLELRNANPSYTFTNSAGEAQAFVSFGACIWVERGANITIADNVIHNCTNGIFTRSQDLGAGLSTVTQDVRIAGNYLYDNGVVAAEGIHNIYAESLRITYEFNRIGPLKTGAGGNAIKDRSVGTVIRYNHITEGAHSLDLVEPEDFSSTAASSGAALQSAYVYGNIIVKNGDSGTVIHYGGDHAGSEGIYRAGPLYFYHNTVYMTGGWSRLFQLSTTQQTAEIFNNVLTGAADVQLGLHAGQDVDVGWVTGGVLNLGKNFIKSIWWEATDQYHTVSGTLNGLSNLLSTTAPSVDATTFIPEAGTSLIDSAQPLPAAVLSAYPVTFQPATTFSPTMAPVARHVKGAAADLGAIEF